jgi:predicted ATPase/DNA-binding winged helix-turn-helix (wHTH) protein
VDRTRRELRTRGVPVPLGGRAFDIVEVLAQSAGELVTKDEIFRRVWSGAIVEESTLQVHISAIRKALGPDRGMLKTAFGRGYRLLGAWTIRQEGRSAAPVVLQIVPPAVFLTNFPSASSELIGRTSAVRHLQDRLSAYRLVTLIGAGGIGKTALALEVARDLFPTFHGDGQLVELASLADPDLVPAAVSGVLGLELGGGGISAEAVARAIGTRKLLLVLDNCEHVIDAAAKLVETMVRVCPRTTVLATSREVLRIEGECVYRVAPLEVPPEHWEEPYDVLGHSAAELLVARMRALDPDFSPDRDSLAAIAAICRHLDGIPLAIEFAATSAATLGLEQVASRLDDRFALLTRGRRSALPRHRTLRAALDWSYELLPEAERRLFRRLAVFPAGFTLEAAAAVAGDANDLNSAVLEGIANLVAKSLVTREGSVPTGRWRLLETIRAYALERLAESGERERIARRHAEHYRSLFERAEGEAAARPSGDWLADYAREIDNLRAALDWSFSQDDDPALGLNLIAASAPLWFRLSLNSEYRRRVERALRLLSDLSEQDSLVEMRLQIALGHALWYTQGDAELLQQAFARALELADRIGEAPDRLRLQALWGMWAARRGRGQYREALALAIRYEAVARSVGDPAFVLLADRILGLSHHFLGNQGLARRHTEQVRRVARGSENPPNTEFQLSPEVAAASLLTRILWLQGFPDQALAMLGEAIDAAQRSGHRYSMSYVLTFAGCPASVWTGNLSETQKYINMITDIGPGNVAIDHLTRCWSLVLRLRQGDERDVLIASYIEPRLDLSTLSEIVVLGSGSTITMPSPNDEVGDALWSLPEVLRVNAELLLWRDAPGAAEAAEAELLRSIDWARQHSALSWELRAATSLARLQRDLGRTREARDLLASVYGRFTEGFGTADLREARQLIDALT